MTNMQLARKAIQLFPVTDTNRKQGRRHLQRQWISSVKALGNDWIVAQPINRSN